MAQELDLSSLEKERYDIFLCTRGLPDALTPETAAIRQLMSALAGSGYRVFFPSALPKETAAEDLAAAMAAALRTAPVMIAAAVGDEGAADETARFLWKRFRDQDDPARRFIACVRDLSALPEELSGAETLDMGALDFLARLRQRLEEALPGAGGRAEPESAGDALPEEPAEPEIPEPEAPAEDMPSGDPPARKRRTRFLYLAVGLLALLALGILLLIG